MKTRLQRLAARIDALSLRERGLLLFAVLAGLTALWDQLLMVPLQTQQEGLRGRLSAVRGKAQEAETAAHELVARYATDPNRSQRERVGALEADIAGLDGRLRAMTVDLIGPREMARVLEKALLSQTGLRLRRVENLAPERIRPGEPDGASRRSDDLPALYRHGIVIEFDGGYLETLRYLQALEHMSWLLFWDGLEYAVEEFPRARVTLRLHTLSLGEGWIGV
ncbi:MAG: hypothetical protein GWO02_00025 [Gammaproteobacteria bacterium]|nr:hypothetical protein [Gammaproteobacteria bacterium]